MPSPQVLEPVLEMKVDEFFLNWLSIPATQTLLQDYLNLVKSAPQQHLDCSSSSSSSSDSRDETPQVKKSLTFNENNNVASQRNLAEKKPTPPSAASSFQANSTLPSGSCSNTRVSTPNGRALRRSVNVQKKVQNKTDQH